jgi:hypothetical protein
MKFHPKSSQWVLFPEPDSVMSIRCAKLEYLSFAIKEWPKKAQNVLY